MTPRCWSGSCAGQTSALPRTCSCCSEIEKVSLDSFFTREGHEIRDGCPTLGGGLWLMPAQPPVQQPELPAGRRGRESRLSMTGGYWLFRSWFP